MTTSALLNANGVAQLLQECSFATACSQDRRLGRWRRLQGSRPYCRGPQCQPCLHCNESLKTHAENTCLSVPNVLRQPGCTSMRRVMGRMSGPAGMQRVAQLASSASLIRDWPLAIVAGCPIVHFISKSVGIWARCQGTCTECVQGNLQCQQTQKDHGMDSHSKAAHECRALCITTWGWCLLRCPVPPPTCSGAREWRCGVESDPTWPPPHGAPVHT